MNEKSLSEGTGYTVCESRFFKSESKQVLSSFSSQLQGYGDVHESKSLIIFDEVQLCPMARQAIKSLVKDHRYDYIEKGSLISIKRNVKDILIPSEERRIGMYPMDYEEFLWAVGNTNTIPLLKKVFEQSKPILKKMIQRAGYHFCLIQVQHSSIKMHLAIRYPAY